jgi:predicted nucleic acid-binding protein
MSRIFWDTNIFIYLFEANHHFGPLVDAMNDRMVERGDQLMTSAMTLAEILVKPTREDSPEEVREYEAVLRSSAIILPFDIDAARHYAHLRRHRSLKAPDVIQLACAAAANVDLFITNDNRLQQLHVTGIQFIVPIDRVPL